MTTALAQCSKCAALLNDTDEDIAKHRRWHAQFEQDFETIRRVASTASTDTRQLAGQVKDLQRPEAPAEPPQINIRVTDDEELKPDTDDLDQIATETVVTDQDDPDATQAYDIYPAIDRDDDLNTHLANTTGTIHP